MQCLPNKRPELSIFYVCKCEVENLTAFTLWYDYIWR